MGILIFKRLLFIFLVNFRRNYERIFINSIELIDYILKDIVIVSQKNKTECVTYLRHLNS